MRNLLTDRQSRRARRWSNVELAKLGALFPGAVANISGWDDSDKEGSCYRSYFPNAANYVVTNHTGARGLQGVAGEIAFDLEKPPPSDLVGRFDAVLCHTVLEHIFDIFASFRNLCATSRDVVIVVVPFSQIEHWTESYGDYWRFTPQTLDKLFAREGLSLIYHSTNNDFNAAVYLIGVGVRHPDRWMDSFPRCGKRRPLGERIGRSYIYDLLARWLRSSRTVPVER